MDTIGPLAEQLASDLLKQDVYIGLVSDGFTMPLAKAWATMGRTLDLGLRSELVARGRWRGRQPAILVDDVTIEAVVIESSTRDNFDVDRLRSMVTAAITAHEVGHYAEVGIDLEEPTPERHRFADAIAAFSSVVHVSDKFPPFFGHDMEFVRAAIHAAHRVRQMGVEIEYDHLFEGATYGLAEPSQFAYRIEPETFDLEREPLVELKEFRPRLGFVRLWNQCVEYWIAEQPAESRGVELAKTFLVKEREY